LPSPVVDSQVHLQTAGRPRPFFLPRNFLVEDLLAEMAKAGVDRAILVPPTWDPNANAPSLEAAQRYPDRFAVMGRIDIERPDARPVIERWKEQRGMLGIRTVLDAFPPDAWRKGGEAEWLWTVAEEKGVPIMMHVGHHPWQVELFAEIAARHPGLKLIVDHLGARLTNAGNPAAAYGHLASILTLARHANVAVKASGMPTYSAESFPFADLGPYIERVYDAFGPARMFWGTDVTRLTYWGTPEAPAKCTYRQAVTFLAEGFSWLPAADRELIMGKAICDWLGWKI
jgi:predicted TIM-barrel fold metal-dependent hydrolase